MTFVASGPRLGNSLVADTRPTRPAFARPVADESTLRPFRRWLLSSGLYSLTLGRRGPKSFFAVAPDPWPGDAAHGRRILAGEFAAHGKVGPLGTSGSDPP